MKNINKISSFLNQNYSFIFLLSHPKNHPKSEYKQTFVIIVQVLAKVCKQMAIKGHSLWILDEVNAFCRVY